MAQVTHGVRAVLSHPVIYSWFQSMLGAYKFRANFVADFVRPYPGMAILDIGCGPADILAHLPDVKYWGFDINESYIEQARKTFGKQGCFSCEQLHHGHLNRLPEFDLVLSIGLLHHLDDPVALNVLQLAHQALKIGGRMLAVDPCLDPAQNTIARFLIRNDRGQNVRDKNGYEALARSIFHNINAQVRHQTWIPYTHAILECRKT